MTSIAQKISNFLFFRNNLFLILLLLPPVLWLGIIYFGSLFSLLLQSFFYIDNYTGLIVKEISLQSYRDLFTATNFDIILRTFLMALSVTIASAAIGFPIAYFMAHYASDRAKPWLYLGIMLPLWSSYLVRVYAWKLLLAKEGVISWVLDKIHMTWALDLLLDSPVLGGPSLSISYYGTFLVFLYIWLPFMIMPIQAALERIPRTFIEASHDLGGTPDKTFWKVIFPLAFPGVVAGSIFTFSLTLGDYIIPGIIGPSAIFIGQAVYSHQGTAGNVPLAAAFSIVPIFIMCIYLWVAKRLGAFNAI
ncbi:ABC transporter permease [Leptospira sp. GIMC2001]|uniref:ABC transporter permease n=1 Tax=Leptospira sp. GIMC2001 TaxID=1513297 RepID=UPI00234A2A1C|nr:ABC transporter permease [Leptospira sp. GIMC2001]WCL49461.1 ABC transporter permease [Leptospira sp. GIMC2001]